jgi:acyl-ACP thioesterase
LDSKWKYHAEFTVRGYEADFRNRAAVHTFCYYMEEAAGQHAEKLGVSMDNLRNEGVAWVLTRMYVESYDFPQTGQKVYVTTWPPGVDKLQFRRDFELRGEDGGILAKAISQWVVVNLTTRKLERITYDGLSPEEPEYVLEEPRWRIPPQSENPELLQVNVRLSDIDQNNHVNNVHYIEWVTESSPYALDPDKRLASVEILFKAEAKHKDIISVRGGAGEAGGEFCHGLFRVDGTELVRARTIWK